MDKKIRAAAENDKHGYDEKAWQGMEVLLDKHLPQKKTRKRLAFFLLFGLLVISIPAFLIIRKNSSGSNTISSANNPAIEQKAGDKTNTTPASKTAEQKNIPSSLSDASNPASNNPEQANTGTTTDITTNDKTVTTANPSISAPTDNQKIKTIPVSPANKNASMSMKVKNSGFSKPKNIIANTQPQPGKNQPKTKPQPEQALNNNIVSNEPPRVVQNPASTDLTTVPPIKPVTTEPVSNETKASVQTELKTDSSVIATTDAPVKKDKKKSSTASKFSISFSAGPDHSSVGSKPGKWRSQYGIGLGYALSDKWSVRTGFYVARKVYTADTNSYKAPGNGPYFFRLDEIRANCLVYEVPISVVYNFARSKKHNWFVSGGVSSYFMKSEKYDYIYKYQNMTQTHNYEYKNENKHLFSVINLSAGYQYHFSNRLSLMAEPYLKLPVSGIGHGEVKLNSAGLLFTFGYRPFAKR